MTAPDPVSILDLDIRAPLEAVEKELHSAVASDEPLVQEAAVHLIRAGGKRIRPMLLILAAHLGDHTDERLVPCAAAIELTHLATLYHDDVVDEADLRRGAPTVNARFGNSTAILTGDFLFARAAGIAAELGTYVSRVLADTIALVCEGVLMELARARRIDASARGYLEVIRRKTAVLIKAPCHLGGWLAGAQPDVVNAVTDYGEALGMAYQLADDLLDIAGYEESLGKKPGTDLRQGVYTLPVLLTLEGRVPGGRQLRGALDEGDVPTALALLRENGSVDMASRAAEEWERRARAALERIPSGPGRDALGQLAAFVVARSG